jgi:hypothetical protein
MLWTTAVLFVLAWGIGLATSVTLGGLIHILPLTAAVLGYLAVTRARADREQRRIAARHQDDQFGGRKSYRIGGAP